MPSIFVREIVTLGDCQIDLTVIGFVKQTHPLIIARHKFFFSRLQTQLGSSWALDLPGVVCALHR